MIYKKQIDYKDMKISSFILDIPCGKTISIKFLKDPSTRGNSPNFSKPKDEN